ncbi:MAG: tetratricopeptide repeat protein [Elusimicrobia bacterium]|nr:tetratricopeptide repeat protein [Elusimicrobiota bacterium]
MNLSRAGKTIAYLFLGVLTLLFLLVKVQEFDVYLHLSSGKYILDNFKVPQLDPFSYTAANRLYVDSHWLYQVILYIFYSSLSFLGLFLYQLLVVGAIFYVLFRVGQKSNFYITTGCILLTLIISNYRFLYRPEMFSYLFAVLFILILESLRVKRSNLIGITSVAPLPRNDNILFLLPILQIFWTNSHGFFIFGPIIIGCYFIGELIYKKQLAKPILLTGILSVLACFVNPYGYKLAAYPFLLFTEIGSKASPYMKSVSELTPTLFAETGTYNKLSYFLLILISAASFFFSRKFNFSRFFVYLVFLYVSWTTVRNTVFFAFVGSLITIINFTEIKELKIPASQTTLKIAEYSYLVFLTVFSVFVSYNVITNRYFRQERTMQQFGIGKIDILFPTGAIDFIKKNNIRGNIFNDAIIGGYFIWNCWPERKVFVDGKMEIYGEKFLAEYKSVIDNSDVYWQKIADKYKIDYVLLHPLSPHSKNLIKHLYKNKNWQLAYFDEAGLVFVKSSRRLNADYRIKSETTDPLTLLSYANFYFFTEQYQKAQPLYAEVLKLDPDFTEAYINLGAIFIAEKKYNDANACYYRALQLSRKYAEPYFGLAILEVERKNYEMVQFFLEQALRIKPDFAEAQFLLCYVYLKVSRYDDAIKICKELLSRTPADDKLYNLLGSVYFEKGELQEAIKQYEKAISINPNNSEAKQNYQACLDKMNDGRVK